VFWGLKWVPERRRTETERAVTSCVAVPLCTVFGRNCRWRAASWGAQTWPGRSSLPECHARVMYARQCDLAYCCNKSTAFAIPTVTNRHLPILFQPTFLCCGSSRSNENCSKYGFQSRPSVGALCPSLRRFAPTWCLLQIFIKSSCTEFDENWKDALLPGVGHGQTAMSQWYPRKCFSVLEARLKQCVRKYCP